MIRIAVTGPESTGKTTLSEQLAKYFNCKWIPEYARKYLEQTNGIYHFEDLDIIAERQLEHWENHSEDKLCIYDTEMLVMKIWSSFKYKKVSSFIENAYQTQKIDLFLLCKPDIDWEEDALREHPEKREELYNLYFEILSNDKLPFRIIQGQSEERTQSAIHVVEDFFLSSEL